jgi:hypothetical protein
MDDPTCIGCGKKYKTQKQLSAHAARCSKNKSLTLGDVLSKLERKRKSRARDKLRNAKRARLLDEPLEELDIHQENPLDVSLSNFLYINITHQYQRHMPLQGHHICLRQSTSLSSNMLILHFTT